MSELLSLKTILVIALVFVPLERITSLHPRQKILRAHWANDLIYLFLNSILIQLGLLLLTGAAMIGIRLTVPDVVGLSVRSQPLWLQAIEVVVIADCGFYAAHRAFHEVPFLWRFHAIHHSIEEMDWVGGASRPPLGSGPDQGSLGPAGVCAWFFRCSDRDLCVELSSVSLC